MTARWWSRTSRAARSSWSWTSRGSTARSRSSSSGRPSSLGSGSCRTSSRSDRTGTSGSDSQADEREEEIVGIPRAHAQVLGNVGRGAGRAGAERVGAIPASVPRPAAMVRREGQADLDGDDRGHDPRPTCRRRWIARPGRTRRRDLHRGRARHVRPPTRRQAGGRRHRARVRGGEGRDPGRRVADGGRASGRVACGRAPRDDRAKARGPRAAQPSRRRHAPKASRGLRGQGPLEPPVRLGRPEQHVGDLRRPARS